MKKIDLSHLAIIGSGPTAIYLLQYIWTNIDVLKSEIKSLTIFEKEEILGIGMPYRPKTTDIYNLANISSEEIPLLEETFADWLRHQDEETLKKLNIPAEPIDDAEVYSRISLGQYFQDQFQKITTKINAAGIEIIQQHVSEVTDIRKTSNDELCIIHGETQSRNYSAVVIANGHEWKETDKPDSGYYASPWPIHKILPEKDGFFNFTVGTLGASLSAFDVVTSLAHRHGKFFKEEGNLKFLRNENAPDFTIVMHSAKGWLPHLQYEQKEPIREIYRHFTRTQLLNLIDDKGFLNIEIYFDQLCRPALTDAFRKDQLNDVVEKLQDENFSFKDLVALMVDKHEYVNSFEGMKLELVTAEKSVYKKIPIYWMEALDDLMYSLNYHAELLSAEDHQFFHKEIMPFLMNVIAALPLQSAKILLALYEAKVIELQSGMVSFPEDSFEEGKTKILVESENGTTEEISYQLFVNCGGHKKLETEDYPFQSLVKEGVVQTASAEFENEEAAKKTDEEELIPQKNGKNRLKLSGIDIDSSYRTIDNQNTPNPFLYDINFTHTSGLRPYSYGLQACSATSLIVVESWLAEIVKNKEVGTTISDITKLYEENDQL